MPSVAEAYEDLAPEQKSKVDARIGEIRAKLEDVEKRFEALPAEKQAQVKADLQVFRDKVKLEVDKFKSDYLKLSSDDQAKVDAQIKARLEEIRDNLIARMKAL